MQLRPRYVFELCDLSNSFCFGGIFDVRLISRYVITDSFSIVEIIAVPFYHDIITEGGIL